MTRQLEAQGLVASQLAGLRQHGLSTLAALNLIRPSLQGELATDAGSLVAALEQGTVPDAPKTALFRRLATDGDPSAESLRELARGFATAAEAKLAWTQASRPWVLTGAGLLLLHCGAAWAFSALPGQDAEAIGASELGWSVLRAMRWLGIPLAVLWVLGARATWLPLRTRITRPFLLAASLRGVEPGAGGVPDRAPAGGSGREADRLWRPTERAAFQLLRARHGDAVAAQALATDLENEGRRTTTWIAAVSALLCMGAALYILSQLALILYLPIIHVAGRL